MPLKALFLVNLGFIAWGLCRSVYNEVLHIVYNWSSKSAVLPYFLFTLSYNRVSRVREKVMKKSGNSQGNSQLQSMSTSRIMAKAFSS